MLRSFLFNRSYSGTVRPRRLPLRSERQGATDLLGADDALSAHPLRTIPSGRDKGSDVGGRCSGQRKRLRVRRRKRLGRQVDGG
jgi:hypothetical protein